MKTSFSMRIFKYIVPWMAILFLLASIMFFYYQAVTFIDEKADDIEVIIADRADDFEQQFKQIKSELAYAARFSSVKTALLKYDKMTTVEQYETRNRISDDLNGINIFNRYVEDIIIIGKNGFTKNLDSYESLKAGTDPLTWPSITGYRPGSSNFYFTLPYTADYYADTPHTVFSVVLPVKENGETVGYVQGNLNYDRVIGMLETSHGSRQVEGTTFGAITESGDIVFMGDETFSPDASAMEEILKGIGSGESRFTIKQPGRKLIVHERLKESGWIFLGMIDHDYVAATVNRGALVLLFIVLPVSLALMSLAIMLLARRIQKPVEKLKNRVENVDIETYEPSNESYEIREVQVVADKFEESMQRNQKLIREVYEEELLRKDVELEVLRNQITPHFIYNSLQLIKAEAVMSGNREISKSVNALAGLLRYSMHSGTDVVFLKEEIEYIGNYLEIYKRRYVDRFVYEIETDEEALEQKIPKMILQPLAENSIRHGFADVKSGGIVRIVTKYKEGRVTIRIEDNGCGISEERRRKLLEGIREPEGAVGKEIGLLNVHRRIQLQCGKESGISELGNLPGGGFFQVISLKPLSGSDSNGPLQH
ncbi:MAG: sensor histidine kinase [Blautia sp.]|nr:sensor histidine kinase [Blautia sp.]